MRMPARDRSVHLLRLRFGMAAVVVFQALFWMGRHSAEPGAALHEGLRLAIIATGLAAIAFTYLPAAERGARAAALVAGTVLLVLQPWLAAAQGLSMDRALPAMILGFVVCAIAASNTEVAVFTAGSVLATVASALAYAGPAGVPWIAVLLMLGSSVGGATIGLFRLRSEAQLTREIARRRTIESELRAAQAHLESILHGTSDGLLGVHYDAGGPLITFANRRFGEIFGFDPASVVGRRDEEVRALAAPSFRHPEDFERGVRALYERREDAQLVELEVAQPRPAVIERWSGPIRDQRGTAVGRIWSFRDVTQARAMAREREEYAARLEATNTELARASRAKDAFLANLSHELRTPLSVIIGYLKLVLEGGLTPEESAEFVLRSTASATHLLQLISDMLDLTRLEAGTAEIEVEQLPVAPVVHEVHALTQVLASAKGLELRVDADPAVRVLADRQRLKQVLLNLVGNALKFTHAGHVAVTAAARNGHVEFRVRDTGRGIPLDQQGLLFRKFMRLDTRTTATEEGVGLGLSICRELVTLMGGRIELASEGPGRGTEVRFTLPRVAE
jgi:signal transduction histidine kinase